MGNPNIKNHGFGSRPKEVDDEYRSRAKGIPRKRIWTKDKCIEELEDCLNLFKKVLKDDDKINIGNPTKLKTETIRDANNIMNRILQFVQYLYPPIAQNVNLNIDVTTDNVMSRLKEWKETEQIVEIVIPEVENDLQIN